LRIDTHIYSGYTIPPFYDSLIAKVLVLGANRSEAIVRMQRLLKEMTIDGIKTTMPLHQKIMANDYFHKGNVYTDFLPKYIFGGE
jgi:acetyl-CoA carboxylase biotin carboxylase subunit